MKVLRFMTNWMMFILNDNLYFFSNGLKQPNGLNFNREM